MWVLAGTWERGVRNAGALSTCRLGDPAPLLLERKDPAQAGERGRGQEMEAPRVSVFSPHVSPAPPTPTAFLSFLLIAVTFLPQM